MVESQFWNHRLRNKIIFLGVFVSTIALTISFLAHRPQRQVVLENGVREQLRVTATLLVSNEILTILCYRLMLS